MSTCIKVLKEPAPEAEPAVRASHSPFSLYVAEKLSPFDRKTRMIAEKRISDVIFEFEMKENSVQPFGQYQLQELQPTDTSGISSSYMNFLQSTQQYR